MMKRIKSLMLVAALALLSLTAAYAKSFEIEIRTPVKAGKVELKPGKYTIQVQGDNAVVNGGHKESYTLPVKVENGTTKFKATMVDSAEGRIRFIEFGGTTMRVQFTD